MVDIAGEAVARALHVKDAQDNHDDRRLGPLAEGEAQTSQDHDRSDEER